MSYIFSQVRTSISELQSKLTEFPPYALGEYKKLKRDGSIQYLASSSSKPLDGSSKFAETHYGPVFYSLIQRTKLVAAAAICVSYTAIHLSLLVGRVSVLLGTLGLASYSAHFTLNAISNETKKTWQFAKLFFVALASVFYTTSLLASFLKEKVSKDVFLPTNHSLGALLSALKETVENEKEISFDDVSESIQKAITDKVYSSSEFKWLERVNFDSSEEGLSEGINSQSTSRASSHHLQMESMQELQSILLPNFNSSRVEPPFSKESIRKSLDVISTIYQLKKNLESSAPFLASPVSSNFHNDLPSLIDQWKRDLNENVNDFGSFQSYLTRFLENNNQTRAYLLKNGFLISLKKHDSSVKVELHNTVAVAQDVQWSKVSLEFNTQNKNDLRSFLPTLLESSNPTAALLLKSKAYNPQLTQGLDRASPIKQIFRLLEENNSARDISEFKKFSAFILLHLYFKNMPHADLPEQILQYRMAILHLLATSIAPASNQAEDITRELALALPMLHENLAPLDLSVDTPSTPSLSRISLRSSTDELTSLRPSELPKPPTLEAAQRQPGNSTDSSTSLDSIEVITSTSRFSSYTTQLTPKRNTSLHLVLDETTLFDKSKPQTLSKILNELLQSGTSNLRSLSRNSGHCLQLHSIPLNDKALWDNLSIPAPVAERLIKNLSLSASYDIFRDFDGAESVTATFEQPYNTSASNQMLLYKAMGMIIRLLPHAYPETSLDSLKPLSRFAEVIHQFEHLFPILDLRLYETREDIVAFFNSLNSSTENSSFNILQDGLWKIDESFIQSPLGRKITELRGYLRMNPFFASIEKKFLRDPITEDKFHNFYKDNNILSHINDNILFLFGAIAYPRFLNKIEESLTPLAPVKHQATLSLIKLLSFIFSLNAQSAPKDILNGLNCDFVEWFQNNGKFYPGLYLIPNEGHEKEISRAAITSPILECYARSQQRWGGVSMYTGKLSDLETRFNSRKNPVPLEEHTAMASEDSLHILRKKIPERILKGASLVKDQTFYAHNENTVVSSHRHRDRAFHEDFQSILAHKSLTLPALYDWAFEGESSTNLFESKNYSLILSQLFKPYTLIDQINEEPASLELVLRFTNKLHDTLSDQLSSADNNQISQDSKISYFYLYSAISLLCLEHLRFFSSKGIISCPVERIEAEQRSMTSKIFELAEKTSSEFTTAARYLLTSLLKQQIINDQSFGQESSAEEKLKAYFDQLFYIASAPNAAEIHHQLRLNENNCNLFAGAYQTDVEINRFFLTLALKEGQTSFNKMGRMIARTCKEHNPSIEISKVTIKDHEGWRSADAATSQVILESSIGPILFEPFSTVDHPGYFHQTFHSKPSLFSFAVFSQLFLFAKKLPSEDRNALFEVQDQLEGNTSVSTLTHPELGKVTARLIFAKSGSESYKWHLKITRTLQQRSYSVTVDNQETPPNWLWWHSDVEQNPVAALISDLKGEIKYAAVHRVQRSPSKQSLYIQERPSLSANIYVADKNGTIQENQQVVVNNHLDLARQLAPRFFPVSRDNLSDSLSTPFIVDPEKKEISEIRLATLVEEKHPVVFVRRNSHLVWKDEPTLKLVDERLPEGVSDAFSAYVILTDEMSRYVLGTVNNSSDGNNAYLFRLGENGKLYPQSPRSFLSIWKEWIRTVDFPFFFENYHEHLLSFSSKEKELFLKEALEIQTKTPIESSIKLFLITNFLFQGVSIQNSSNIAESFLSYISSIEQIPYQYRLGSLLNTPFHELVAIKHLSQVSGGLNSPATAKPLLSYLDRFALTETSKKLLAYTEAELDETLRYQDGSSTANLFSGTVTRFTVSLEDPYALPANATEERRLLRSLNVRWGSTDSELWLDLQFVLAKRDQQETHLHPFPGSEFISNIPENFWIMCEMLKSGDERKQAQLAQALILHCQKLEKPSNRVLALLFLKLLYKDDYVLKDILSFKGALNEYQNRMQFIKEIAKALRTYSHRSNEKYRTIPKESFVNTLYRTVGKFTASSPETLLSNVLDKLIEEASAIYQPSNPLTIRPLDFVPNIRLFSLKEKTASFFSTEELPSMEKPSLATPPAEEIFAQARLNKLSMDVDVAFNRIEKRSIKISESSINDLLETLNHNESFVKEAFGRYHKQLISTIGLGSMPTSERHIAASTLVKAYSTSEENLLGKLEIAFAEGSLQALKEVIPTLGDALAVQLQQLLAAHLFLKVRLNQIQRAKEAITRLQSVDSADRVEIEFATSHLYEILQAESLYDPKEYPYLLVYEARSGFMLFHKQIEMLKHLATIHKTDKKELIIQLIMGSGKSEVISVIQSYLNADGKHLSLVVLPDSLLLSQGPEKKHRCKAMFGQDVEILDYSLSDATLSITYLQSLHYTLLGAISQRKTIDVSSSSLHGLMHAFHLTYEGCHTAMQSGNRAELETLIKRKDILKSIISLIRTKAIAVFDEPQKHFMATHEHNSSVGVPQASDPRECSLVATVLDTLLYELDSLVKIKEREQYLISLEDYKVVSRRLAEKIYDTVFSSFHLNKEEFLLYVLEEDKEAAKEFLEDLEFHRVLSDPSEPKYEMCSMIALIKQLLGGKLLFDSLSGKRVGEHYGFSQDMSINPNLLIAIPYHNSNPEEYSRIVDPYETMIKTYVAYVQKGLEVRHIEVLLNRVLEDAHREKEDLALSSVDETTVGLKVKELTKVPLSKLTSDHHKPMLESINAKQSEIAKWFFNYFISEVVFATIQIYVEQINTTAIDLGNLPAHAQGYSGTVENEKSFPDRFKVQEDIGTNGQTILEILSKDCSVFSLNESDPLTLMKELFSHGKKYNAWIDVGAVFADFENRKVAESFLEYFKQTDSPIEGIIYYDNNRLVCLKAHQNEPILLRSSSLKEIRRKTQLPPDKYFVFFDEGHTTGANIPLAWNARAVCTVNFPTTMTAFLQGVKRLRGFSKAQQIDIAYPAEAKDRIYEQISKPSTEDLSPKEIIAYTNLCESNQLMQHSLKACCNKIRDTLRQKVLDKLLAAEDNADLQVYKALRGLIVDKIELDPWELYRQIAEPQETKHFLEQYAKSLLSTYQSQFTTKEIQSIQGEMDKIIRSHLAHTPSSVPAPLGNTNQCLHVQVQRTVEREQVKETTITAPNEKPIEGTPLSALQLPDDFLVNSSQRVVSPQKDALSTMKTLPKSAQRAPRIFKFGDILSQSIKLSKFASQFDDNILISENLMRITDKKLPSIMGPSDKVPGIVLIEKTAQGWKFMLTDKEEACRLKWLLRTSTLSSDSTFWLMTTSGNIIQNGRIAFNEDLRKEPAFLRGITQCMLISPTKKNLLRNPYITGLAHWLKDKPHNIRKELFSTLCTPKMARMLQQYLNNAIESSFKR